MDINAAKKQKSPSGGDLHLQQSWPKAGLPEQRSDRDMLSVLTSPPVKLILSSNIGNSELFSYGYPGKGPYTDWNSEDGTIGNACADRNDRRGGEEVMERGYSSKLRSVSPPPASLR